MGKPKLSEMERKVLNAAHQVQGREQFRYHCPAGAIIAATYTGLDSIWPDNRAAVRNAIQRLRRKGLIKSTERGWYRVVTPRSEA